MFNLQTGEDHLLCRRRAFVGCRVCREDKDSKAHQEGQEGSIALSYWYETFSTTLSFL